MLNILVGVELYISSLKKQIANWLVGGELSGLQDRYNTLEDYCISLSHSYSQLVEVSTFLQAYYDAHNAYDESGYSPDAAEALWWADDDDIDLEPEFDDCEPMTKLHDL